MSAHAHCRIGDVATVVWEGDQYRSGYKFSSLTTVNDRVLPIGTRVTITDIQYANFSGMSYIARAEVIVYPLPKIIPDPSTGVNLSCVPVVGEAGRFIPPQTGFFGTEFLSCLHGQ